MLISLSQDFLAVADKAYTMWDNFRPEVQAAEAALKEVYGPAFYARVGLRYRDVISRAKLSLEGTDWKDLLKPHILAELGAPDVCAHIRSIRTQAVIETPEVEGGRVRLIHGLLQEVETSETCYIIDADFWVESKEGFNEPLDILNRFNRLAGRLFRWAITDALHDAMQPRSV